MHVLGLFRLAVDKHLELVELVDAEDAAGVLATGAGLAAEAGRPAGVLERAVLEIDDLVLVVARERDLGGADEVQVIRREVVNLVRVLAEEAGAGHDLRTHEHRRDHELEASLACLLRGEHEHAQLQEGAVAGEVVEARAAHLGAALDVEETQGLAQLHVILRLEVEGGNLADLLKDDEVILAAGGCALDDVGELVLQLGDLLLGRDLLGLGFLDLGLELIRALEKGWALLQGGLTDLLAKGLLLGTQLVGRDDSGAAALVCSDEGVDQRRILAAGDLGGTDNVWVFAEELEINHATILAHRDFHHGLRSPRGRPLSCPVMTTGLKYMT